MSEMSEEPPVMKKVHFWELYDEFHRTIDGTRRSQDPFTGLMEQGIEVAQAAVDAWQVLKAQGFKVLPPDRQLHYIKDYGPPDKKRAVEQYRGTKWEWLIPREGEEHTRGTNLYDPRVYIIGVPFNKGGVSAVCDALCRMDVVSAEGDLLSFGNSAIGVDMKKKHPLIIYVGNWRTDLLMRDYWNNALRKRLDKGASRDEKMKAAEAYRQVAERRLGIVLYKLKQNLKATKKKILQFVEACDLLVPDLFKERPYFTGVLGDNRVQYLEAVKLK